MLKTVIKVALMLPIDFRTVVVECIQLIFKGPMLFIGNYYMIVPKSYRIHRLKDETPAGNTDDLLSALR